LTNPAEIFNLIVAYRGVLELVKKEMTLTVSACGGYSHPQIWQITQMGGADQMDATRYALHIMEKRSKVKLYIWYHNH
jgi:hypothetical protein